MTTPPDPTSGISPRMWRKSSISGGGTGTECVEIAVIGEDTYLRDSKDPQGPVLRFAADEIRGFIHAVKAGEFDSLT